MRFSIASRASWQSRNRVDRILARSHALRHADATTAPDRVSSDPQRGAGGKSAAPARLLQRSTPVRHDARGSRAARRGAAGLPLRSARLGALYGGADVDRAGLVSGRYAHHPAIPPRPVDGLAARLADAALSILTYLMGAEALERLARLAYELRQRGH